MSAEERNLLEMVQLAVIAADDGDTPDGMRASHTEELPRVHAFRLELGQHPESQQWRITLQEQIAAVPPARRLVWVVLGGLRAKRPQSLEGPSLRRYDWVLDTVDMPAAGQDLQDTLQWYRGELADAKVSVAADKLLFLGAVLGGGALGALTGWALAGVWRESERLGLEVCWRSQTARSRCWLSWSWQQSVLISRLELTRTSLPWSATCKRTSCAPPMNTVVAASILQASPTVPLLNVLRSFSRPQPP